MQRAVRKALLFFILLIWTVTSQEEPSAKLDKGSGIEFDRDLVVYFAVIAMVLGFVECCFGWMLLRLTTFLSGMVFFGAIAYLGLTAAETFNTDLRSLQDHTWLPIANLILSGFYGLLGGFLTASVLNLGVFSIGGLLGGTLGLMANAVFAPFLYPFSGVIPIAVIGGLWLVCGLVSVCYQRDTVIVASSLAGSYSFYRGLSYFCGKWPADLPWVPASQTTWQWYLYGIGICVFAGLGLSVQYRLASWWERRQPQALDSEDDIGMSNRSNRSERNSERLSTNNPFDTTYENPREPLLRSTQRDRSSNTKYQATADYDYAR